MTVIQRSASVPFSSEQMFNLVNNIEQYPQFLPWCAKSLVRSRTSEHIEATLYIAKGPIKKSFTTINRLLPYEGIEMRLVEGPFRRLEGIWRFKESVNGCHITLNLNFELNNPLLAMTFGPLFQHIASTFVQSFSNRAHQIYVLA